MTNAHKLMPCVITIATLAGAVPAIAEWQFEQGEGQLYAYTTDGGFVQGSYQNAMFFFCQDGLGYCELSITIDGKQPQPRDRVTFTFDDGSSLEAMAESVSGSNAVVGYYDAVLDGLKSNASVDVSFTSGESHIFSLSGSSAAMAQAEVK